MTGLCSKFKKLLPDYLNAPTLLQAIGQLGAGGAKMNELGQRLAVVWEMNAALEMD